MHCLPNEGWETALTPQQRRAVDADARALEIRAGAGTGKTTTLAHRVARLAAESRAPHRLLVVTFTREATATLERRLGILLGRDHAVRVGSFHQWAARELPPEDRQFIPEQEARRILQRALGAATSPLRRALGAGGEDGAEDAAARVAGILSYVKNRQTTLGDALSGPLAHLAPWEDLLRRAQDAYEERKGERLDYDDLLIAFRDRLKRSSSFRKDVAERLDHLFVDEYQDVNGIQDDIVHLVASPRGRVGVTVVGDARQSIYAFRGGAPAHLENFLAPYGRKGKRVALTVNFRASRALVAAGNAALPDEFALKPRPRAPRGEPARVWACGDAAEEATRVADRMERLLAQEEDAREIAVLARSRFLLHPLIDELRARLADDAWAAREPQALLQAMDAAARAGPAALLGDKAHARAAGILVRRARAHGLPAKPKPKDLLRLRDPLPLADVTISTIHASKGLEWDHVILVGAREGGLPSEQALRAPDGVRDAGLAEERRLLYVAVTRARKTFVASWSPGGRRETPSRFLAALEPPAPPTQDRTRTRFGEAVAKVEA